jgi:hypothetical protein
MDGDSGTPPDSGPPINPTDGGVDANVGVEAGVDANGGIDGDVGDGGAPTDSYTCATPPSAFNLMAPSAAATNESTRTIFDWENAIDPDTSTGDEVTYHLMVSDRSDFATLAFERSYLTNSQYTLTPAEALEFGMTYYGKVEATDRCGNTVSTLPLTFATRPYAFCSKTGSDVRITNASAELTPPALVWTGNEIGLSWSDNRDGDYEIYFNRISDTGVPVGPDMRITNAIGVSRGPSLVWTGSEYGLAWLDNRDGGDDEIYFRRISASGLAIGSDIRVTNDINGSKWPSLAWSGNEYGVSWHDTRDGNREIYFRRISGLGVPLDTDVRITNAVGDSWDSSLVSTGTEYAVSWDDNRDGNREIYFRRISGAGVPIGSEVRVTNSVGTSSVPSLVWDGSEYGVSWLDNRDGNYQIYFALISNSGALIATDIRITNSSSNSMYPSLVWAEREYGVAWQDDRDGNTEIYFNRISELGALITSDLRVTNDIGTSEVPAIVWTGNGYGISWLDNRSGNSEIYYAPIGCEP